MKKYSVLYFLLVGVIFASCTSVTPDYGQEAVLIHKPWIFGHGGVDATPVETGLAYTWPSTDYVIVNMLPQKYDETLDDVTSNDNTLLDFNTQIQLQVKDNKSAVLVANYGLNWYDNVVRERYRNTVRNYISKYGPFDLMSNREVLDSINQMVKDDIIAHIALVSEKSGELPVDVIDVLVGRAIPNDKQKEEMNLTAAATQAKRTEESRREMLIAKEAAERQRAIADNAYQMELGLTTDQFIQLRAWDIISQKEGANIDVMFNADGTNKMWNIRR